MPTSNNLAPAFLDEYAGDTPKPPSDKLEQLQFWAHGLVRLQQLKNTLEAQLEECNKEIYELASVKIPEMMEDIGVDSVGVLGTTIKLKAWYSAKLPSDPESRKHAMDWLRTHGAGDLAKTEVSVQFGRAESNLAMDVAGHLDQYMQEQGAPHLVAIQDSIHHMTYTAWVRERIEAGETLPLDLLGAKMGHHAVIEDKRRK